MNQQTPDSTETRQLLEQVRSGSQSALNQLLDRHRPYIWRLVDLRMDHHLKRRVDPSDIVQETFIQATRRIDDYVLRQPMSFRLWLRATAKEQIMMAYRRHVTARRRTAERDVSLPENSSIALAQSLISGGPSKELRRRELADAVQRAVDQLSEQDRELLLMRNLEQLSNLETAEALGLTAKAASKRYGRVLLRLRGILMEGGLSGI